MRFLDIIACIDWSINKFKYNEGFVFYLSIMCVHGDPAVAALVQCRASSARRVFRASWCQTNACACVARPCAARRVVQEAAVKLA